MHPHAEPVHGAGRGTTRGKSHALLAERPDNSLPLDSQRNRVDLPILDGAAFACSRIGTRF